MYLTACERKAPKFIYGDIISHLVNAKGLIVDEIIRDYGSELNYNRKKWN